MKVPPKRKGNPNPEIGCARSTVPQRKSLRKGREIISNFTQAGLIKPLNESPSEKEGKSSLYFQKWVTRSWPSMKVPPKRKGNRFTPSSPQRSNTPQ